MKQIHELHNHPITEYRENIPKTKVLVDKEFGRLFSQTWEYWDDNHVIVLKSEFDRNRKAVNQPKQNFVR